MKLTTQTQVTVDGVMQGNGGATDEDRRNGFDRGGWALGAGDRDTQTFIVETYQRADGFLFGRRTYELFASLVDELQLIIIPVILGQGARLFPDAGPDIALQLVDSRTDSKGVTIQVYRPNGGPQYVT